MWKVKNRNKAFSTFNPICGAITKFGKNMKIDMFYTLVKKIMTSLIIRDYDVITLFYPTHRPKFKITVTHNLLD